MTTPSIVDPATVLTNALGDASPDLMRTLLQTMINTLLSAEADAICGAEYGKPSADRAKVRGQRCPRTRPIHLLTKIHATTNTKSSPSHVD